jgi:DNA-binding response OmpR family regulator
MPPTEGEKSLTPRDKFPTRVLIVDDEPLVCWSLAAGLRIAGFDAITATTGAEALALARRTPHPTVVLLDVRLSHGDRSALLRDLRIAAPACQLRWLTTETQDPGAPIAEGMMTIRKPFDLAEVVRVVCDATCRRITQTY